MFVFILRRLAQAVPVLLGVLVIAFLVTRFTPGDPARIMAGAEASEIAVQAMRERLGLDQPGYVQFFLYLGRVLQGDLGSSYHLGRDVVSLLQDALPRTASLAVIALIVTASVGIPTGIVSAIRKDTWWDALARFGALLGVSIPAFFAGLLMILLFSYYLGWFPSYGSGSIRHVILPGITLGLFSTGLVARLTRASMLDIMGQDYVRTGRAKGLGERIVIFKHALRNASISIVTIMGLQLGSLLSGSVLTETVFAYPGIGRLLVRSIFERDYPVVQGVILLIALIYLIANLLVDITYAAVDPRIRYS
ncbi:MAG: ABC transporter permease [Trueperaceae bacterium]|nr:ABC transporter permease [Trueperaceae bacterium]MDZ7799965.1 ABC transporter permease [Trueperaceae bacterium]